MSLQALIEKFKKHGDDFGHICDDDKAKLRDACEVLKRFAESIKTPHPASHLDWMLAKNALEIANSICGEKP